jgi:RNA polymerase primary sigma factor
MTEREMERRVSEEWMQAAVKSLAEISKGRGCVTYDEMNSALPTDEVSSEFIEELLEALSDVTTFDPQNHRRRSRDNQR